MRRFIKVAIIFVVVLCSLGWANGGDAEMRDARRKAEAALEHLKYVLTDGKYGKLMSREEQAEASNFWGDYLREQANKKMTEDALRLIIPEISNDQQAINLQRSKGTRRTINPFSPLQLGYQIKARTMPEGPNERFAKPARRDMHRKDVETQETIAQQGGFGAEGTQQLNWTQPEHILLTPPTPAEADPYANIREFGHIDAPTPEEERRQEFIDNAVEEVKSWTQPLMKQTVPMVQRQNAIAERRAQLEQLGNRMPGYKAFVLGDFEAHPERRQAAVKAFGEQFVKEWEEADKWAKDKMLGRAWCNDVKQAGESEDDYLVRRSRVENCPVMDGYNNLQILWQRDRDKMKPLVEKEEREQKENEEAYVRERLKKALAPLEKTNAEAFLTALNDEIERMKKLRQKDVRVARIFRNVMLSIAERKARAGKQGDKYLLQVWDTLHKCLGDVGELENARLEKAIKEREKFRQNVLYAILALVGIVIVYFLTKLIYRLIKRYGNKVSLISAAAAGLLLAGASGNMGDEYSTFMRVAICVYGVIGSMQYWRRGNNLRTVLAAGLAILYNPAFPVAMRQSEWMWADIAGAIIVLVLLPIQASNRTDEKSTN